MTILSTVRVPHELPKEEQDKRQTIFNAEVDSICRSLVQNDPNFKRGFRFYESADMPGEIRELYAFPDELNIPIEIQHQLAASWTKLFDSTYKVQMKDESKFERLSKEFNIFRESLNVSHGLQLIHSFKVVALDLSHSNAPIESKRLVMNKFQQLFTNA